MTLIHLFLIHRYKVVSVHYLTPTDDNHRQTDGMKAMGIFDEVNDEVGQIIVADVNTGRVQELLDPDGGELRKLIGNASR
jgi:isocitrate lyase